MIVGLCIVLYLAIGVPLSVVLLRTGWLGAHDAEEALIRGLIWPITFLCVAVYAPFYAWLKLLKKLNK